MAERWIDGRKETGFYISTRETADCVYLVYAESADHALRAFVEEGKGDEVASDVIESVRLTDPNPLPPWSPEALKPDPEAAEAEEAKSPPAALPWALTAAIEALREVKGHDDRLDAAEKPPTGDDYNDTFGRAMAALDFLEQFVATGGVRAGEYEATVAELRRLDRENVKLASALQWLLDDMHDADETHDPEVDPNAPDAPIYDSVENAAAALVENNGTLYWYSLERAAAYRAKEKAQNEAEG